MSYFFVIFATEKVKRHFLSCYKSKFPKVKPHYLKSGSKQLNTYNYVHHKGKPQEFSCKAQF